MSVNRGVAAPLAVVALVSGRTITYLRPMRRRLFCSVCWLVGAAACARPTAESEAREPSARPLPTHIAPRPRAPDGITGGPTALTESDPTGEDGFGYWLNAAPDMLVVSGYEHHAIGGSPLTYADGVAYLFEPDGGVWSQVQELGPPVPRDAAYFAAAFARDGDTLAIGAPHDAPVSTPADAGSGPGSVYVYTRAGTSPWTFAQRLDPPDGAPVDEFGDTVVIVGDTLFVASTYASVTPAAGPAITNAGKVYGYKRTGGTWSLAPGSPFNDGATGSDEFGQSMAFDGSTLVVGATYANSTGAVYVYAVAADGSVALQQTLSPPFTEVFSFGFSVALFGDGLLVSGTEAAIDASAGGVGQVFYFTRPAASGPTGRWTDDPSFVGFQSPTPSGGDQYGYELALSATAALIGAPGEGSSAGAAYLFERTDPSSPFTFTTRIAPPAPQPNAQMGCAVALSGANAWVGATLETPSGFTDPTGEVYGYLLGDAGLTDAALDATIEDAEVDAADADAGSTDADTGATDADTGGTDADTGATDADTGATDADTGSTDAGSMSTDADTGSTDAGSMSTDAGAPDDAGSAAIATTGLGACAQSTDCASGHCVDGVCCDTACDGPCESCVLAIAPGRCTPEPYGYDLHHDCQSASCATTCNGSGACAPVTTGAQCAPVHCVDATHTQGAAFCSGVGASCATSLGAVDDCAPYVCFDATGSCLSACVNSSECAQGNVCDLPQGVCVVDPASGSSGGCAVARGGAGDRPSTAAIALGVCAAMAVRRRRARTTTA